MYKKKTSLVLTVRLTAGTPATRCVSEALLALALVRSLHVVAELGATVSPL